MKPTDLVNLKPLRGALPQASVLNLSSLCIKPWPQWSSPRLDDVIPSSTKWLRSRSSGNYSARAVIRTFPLWGKSCRENTTVFFQTWPGRINLFWGEHPGEILMSRESACVLCPNDLTMNGLVTQSLKYWIQWITVEGRQQERMMPCIRFGSLNGNGKKEAPLPSKSKMYRFTGLFHRNETPQFRVLEVNV